MMNRRSGQGSREARRPHVHDVQSEVRQFAQRHHRDPDTGLPGHRTFQTDLALERTRTGRISVVLVQVESIHDLPDEEAVSAALRTVVSLIDATRRATDRCYRVSASQFALVCPGTRPSEAEELVARLERTLVHAVLPGHRLKTIVSWSVAEGTPAEHALDASAGGASLSAEA